MDGFRALCDALQHDELLHYERACQLAQDFKDGRIDDMPYNEDALLFRAYPYLITGYLLSPREAASFAILLNLVFDVADHIKEHGELPRRSYEQCRNLGRRYSRFKSNYPDGTLRRTLFSTLLSHVAGKASVPSELSWHEQRRRFHTHGKYATKWNEVYLLLSDLKSRKGTCRTLDHKVAGDSPDSIAMRWAYRQKAKYQKGDLTPEQVSKLEKIGFFSDFRL